MKTALKILAGLSAVSALAGLASTAQAQATSTATAQASATIVQPITVASSGTLGFGSVAAGSGGTVSVNSSGVRATTGGVQLLGGTGGGSVPTFTVAGLNSATYSYTLTAPANNVLKGTTSASNTLPISLTATNATGATTVTNTASGTGTGKLSATGTDPIVVTGTVTLAATQAADTYTGTIQVDVAYN